MKIGKPSWKVNLKRGYLKLLYDYPHLGRIRLLNKLNLLKMYLNNTLYQNTNMFEMLKEIRGKQNINSSWKSAKYRLKVTESVVLKFIQSHRSETKDQFGIERKSVKDFSLYDFRRYIQLAHDWKIKIDFLEIVEEEV